MVLWELFLVFIKYTWPLWAVIGGIGFIVALLGGGGYETSCSSSSSSKKCTYETTGSVDGLYRSTTKRDGSTAEHYSIDCLKGVSFKSGNDTYHYNSDGSFGGHSHSSDGRTIQHYDKDHMPAGHTVIDENGNAQTYDKWGLPTSESNKR